MTRKEKNNRKTDQAWTTLYNRLEKDGLITQAETPRPSLRLTAFKWTAAAVILLCAYLSINYFNQTEQVIDRNLLTRQNKETITLATTLEDGSIVYLAGNAAIHYPEHFQPDKREISLQGNALFDIAGNRTRPFLIETEDTRIEVLGTAFNVKSDGSQPFELSVQRGMVKVTLKKSGQDVYVKAGETATLSSRKLQVSQTKNPDQFSEITQQIRFKDERLADILRIINLNTGDIRLQAIPALESRTLTVTFSNNSPESIAELICAALNLKYTRDKNVFTLHEN
ncbi:FecR domain-containing protein [uncultured Parabacteroides sp.]|jgi:ferric-dicitrate binding protein FerR (iron transport regulator)|uniref:FecR family protein n=1 Tax=uncultured Parabacteroides sp. TaxID=512312 RepID=UPI0025E67F20|nr:FecR domain-containing protein [uncultured Parabacteroides sp.]